MILHLVNHRLGVMGARDHRTAVPTNRCLGFLGVEVGGAEQFLPSTPNCSTDSQQATLGA